MENGKREKEREKEHPHSVLHTRITLGTKFQLKVIIFFFGPSLFENGISD